VHSELLVAMVNGNQGAKILLEIEYFNFEGKRYPKNIYIWLSDEKSIAQTLRGWGCNSFEVNFALFFIFTDWQLLAVRRHSQQAETSQKGPFAKAEIKALEAPRYLGGFTQLGVLPYD
jgi:hypothetical protein